MVVQSLHDAGLKGKKLCEELHKLLAVLDRLDMHGDESSSHLAGPALQTLGEIGLEGAAARQALEVLEEANLSGEVRRGAADVGWVDGWVLEEAQLGIVWRWSHLGAQCGGGPT